MNKCYDNYEKQACYITKFYIMISNIKKLNSGEKFLIITYMILYLYKNLVF